MHNHQHAVENLYEIPNCTICLSELSQDLTNLGCGHVFHLNCISQHFQYRGTCPNCQKRSNSKEIRMVVYQLTRNTQSASLLRQVIGNLPADNQQQMQALFKQFHGANQRNERLERQNAQLQKQQKKLITDLDLSKTECNRVKNDLAELRKVNVELKNVIEHLHSEIKRLNEQNFNMAQVVEQYKENKAEYQKLRKLKKILAEKSASLISYKNELQNQGTRPQQMAKQFFEMVQIKHLDIIKLKSEMQSHPQRLQQKDDQIEKLRSIVSKYKAEVKDLQEKRTVQRKKFEDTKVKYKNLADKYKAIRANQLNQPESQQQNFEDSLLSRPSFPLGPAPKLNTSNISFNSNSNGSNPISRVRQQNDPFAQNRASKKNITQHFDNTMIIEEESDKASSTVKNTFEKKPASQGTLNGFVQMKPQMGSFGSFGGLAAKKKSEDNRKPAMRNIFG